MTRSELDGYLNALAVLNGGKPAAVQQQPGVNTRVIKSMRKKRKRGK